MRDGCYCDKAGSIVEKAMRWQGWLNELNMICVGCEFGRNKYPRWCQEFAKKLDVLQTGTEKGGRYGERKV